MKLLLSSQGFSNKTIIDALVGLTGKSITETKIAVVPTASLYSNVNKQWWVDEMSNIGKAGFAHIDIVDISAHPRDNWQPRLESTDVIYFTGDEASHLLHWINQSGLRGIIGDLAKNRVIMGNSAGNAVLGPDLEASSPMKRTEYNKKHDVGVHEGLRLMDFYVVSHYKSEKHKRDPEKIQMLANETSKTIYLIDDQSALACVDGEVVRVGEGEYLELRPQLD